MKHGSCMQSGYKVWWSEPALAELRDIINHLQQHFTEREIRILAQQIERELNIICLMPHAYPLLNERPTVRKCVLRKEVILFYRVGDQEIEVVSIFDTRRDPENYPR